MAQFDPQLNISTQSYQQNYIVTSAINSSISNLVSK